MIDKIKTFAVIGGDKRQLFLAKSISDRCYDVILGGFDRLESTGALKIADIKTAINDGDAVIFPLPSVRADRTVNTPFSDKCTLLDEDDCKVLVKKPVFVSMRDKFLKAYPTLGGGKIYDYSAEEEFAVLNAVPTAEGAIECAMQNFEGTIDKSRCMITGFGRIGKILSHKLKLLGAEVAVTARRQSGLAYASALGYETVRTERLRSVKGFDVVFNTIPSMIFDKNLLMNTDSSTLIIDLASLPGGVDFEAAHALGLDAVRALSLPGKCAPKAAGKIIETTVFNIIEEVYG